MKSYIDITGRYLRKQKKRSVLTVVGIILSVALVTGIGTIFLSMYDANMRNTIANYGGFYAAIPGVSANQAEVLAKNVETKKAGFGRELGFAAYADNEKNGIDTPYKYLDVMALDGNAMTMLPRIEVQDGRLPAADGEIALDYWTLKYMPGIKIGDTVSLDLGTRTLPDGTVAADSSTYDAKESFTKTETRQYKLVGTLKPQYIWTLNFAKAVTWIDGDHLPPSEKVTTYLTLKTPKDAARRIQAIADAAGLKTGKGEENAIRYNDNVLKLYAQSINAAFNQSFLIIIFVVMALVVISTIAVIYNAFSISVVERVSQFGLLRCVGATPKQIANIVFREALVLGSIGIPIGIVCGTIAMDIVFSVISAIAPDMLLGGLRLILSPWLVLFSVLVGAVTIYLSALLPARKAAGISPMEAVRGTGVLKKEKYGKTDKHRIVLKMLGAEGWLAWKNLGRNRKRFYITVLSMVISIVLFIVFSSLVGFAFQSNAVNTGDVPSYLISPKNGTDRLDVMNGLTEAESMPGVDYMLMYSDAYAEISVPADKMNPRALDLISKMGMETDQSGNVLLRNCSLICYRDDEFSSVAKGLKLDGTDTEAFKRGDGMILINGGTLTDRSAKKQVLTDITALRPDDGLQVDAITYEGDTNKEIKKDLKILSVVGQGLPGYARNENGGVFMIVSEKLFAEMAPTVNFPLDCMIMMKPGSDHTAVKAKIDDFMSQNPNYNLMDMDEMAKGMKQSMTVMSIFLYGFVVVISLIGCLNIINTISTNIIIRTRELSMLRAIGMGEGSLRKMVALESVLHGAVAALAGSVLGSALSWLLYSRMIAVREFPWQLPWQQILIAVGAAALVAVISGFVPLKRINKGIIMEGIRGEE